MTLAAAAGVAAVQFTPRPAAVAENLERAIELIEAATEGGARVVVLPEAALSGYVLERDEVDKASIEVPGAESERLAELAAARSATLVVGFLERHGDHFHNSALVAQPAASPFIYRKTHLPRMGVDRFVEPGTEAFRPVETPFGRLGVLICYDLRFPEPARILALDGADLLVTPAAWPTTATDYPEFLLRARASENRLPVIAADRCGDERGVRFLGRSQIVGPDAVVIAEAGEDEQIIRHTFDRESLARTRAIAGRPEGPAGLLADRRPELYEGLGPLKLKEPTT